MKQGDTGFWLLEECQYDRDRDWSAFGRGTAGTGLEVGGGATGGGVDLLLLLRETQERGEGTSQEEQREGGCAMIVQGSRLYIGCLLLCVHAVTSCIYICMLTLYI